MASLPFEVTKRGCVIGVMCAPEKPKKPKCTPETKPKCTPVKKSIDTPQRIIPIGAAWSNPLEDTALAPKGKK